MKITSFTYIILFFSLCVTFRAQSQVIATIANIGLKYGYSGDGESESFAEFAAPKGITIYGGNIYIVDQANNRIRMIDGFGDVSTFAGNGKQGFSGDGGLATQAEFNQPTYIIFDTVGNAYISDTHNLRVRKIDTSGMITTIAGNGRLGYEGTNIPATDAALEAPVGLAMDAFGNLYIADGLVVQKVNKDGIITVVAGSPSGGYGGDGGPATDAKCNDNVGIALDSAGNIYIADYTSHVVRKIDQAGIITRYAGTISIANPATGDGGQAINARMVSPCDIKLDKAGNLYITDQGDNRIRKVDVATGIISTFAGTGEHIHNGDGSSAVDAGLYQPYGLTIDTNNNFYVVETDNNSEYLSNDVRIIFGNDFSSTATAAPIEIYPNPTFDGVATLLFASKYADKINIVITNQLGQAVYRNTYVTNLPIEVEVEPTGIYAVYAESSHGKWRGKMSVVR